MKFVVPVSYFQGVPRSELWLIDNEKRSIERWRVLKDSTIAVRGKGVTGVCRHMSQGYLLCDFNRLLHLDVHGHVLEDVRCEEFNDLHAISPCDGGVLLCNTGRDRIERWDA